MDKVPDFTHAFQSIILYLEKYDVVTMGKCCRGFNECVWSNDVLKLLLYAHKVPCTDFEDPKQKFLEYVHPKKVVLNRKIVEDWEEWSNLWYRKSHLGDKAFRHYGGYSLRREYLREWMTKYVCFQQQIHAKTMNMPTLMWEENVDRPKLENLWKFHDKYCTAKPKLSLNVCECGSSKLIKVIWGEEIHQGDERHDVSDIVGFYRKLEKRIPRNLRNERYFQDPKVIEYERRRAHKREFMHNHCIEKDY